MSHFEARSTDSPRGKERGKKAFHSQITFCLARQRTIFKASLQMSTHRRVTSSVLFNCKSLDGVGMGYQQQQQQPQHEQQHRRAPRSSCVKSRPTRRRQFSGVVLELQRPDVLWPARSAFAPLLGLDHVRQLFSTNLVGGAEWR